MRALPASMIESGPRPVKVELARIVNVNITNFTADVRTLHSQRAVTDLQWSNSYFHFNQGEGITFVPEVGAICQLMFPSDSAPFIFAFLTSFEREDHGTTQPEDTDNPTPMEVTYRAGRPRMQQGDILIRTRNGNGVWLHRGGVVEVGATGACKRIYIPLLNTIRDVCENYEVASIAGELSWSVSRSDTAASGEAEALFTLSSRDFAQDEFASVHLKIGHVDDSNRLKLVIAPNSIDPKTGVVTGDAVFSLEIDAEGNMICTVAGNRSVTVKGNDELTVEGNETETIQGDHSQTVQGGSTSKVTAARKMTDLSYSHTSQTGITLEAPSIKHGQMAIWPLVLANPAFILYMAAHTHTILGGLTGPPNEQIPPVAYSTIKTKGE